MGLGMPAEARCPRWRAWREDPGRVVLGRGPGIKPPSWGVIDLERGKWATPALCTRSSPMAGKEGIQTPATTQT